MYSQSHPSFQGIFVIHMAKIYWDRLITTNHFNIILAATAEGLIFVGSNNRNLDELVNWINRNKIKGVLEENSIV